MNQEVVRNGNYQGGKDVDEGFIDNIKLIKDISENGMKEPIRLYVEREGFEIDGYHRLVIMNKLGNKKICTKF